MIIIIHIFSFLIGCVGYAFILIGVNRLCEKIMGNEYEKKVNYKNLLKKILKDKLK